MTEENLIDPKLPFGTKLAPLESFDLAQFVSGPNREVSGFVTALALVYNDINTIIWIRSIIEKVSKGKSLRISAERGRLGGIEWYTWRTLSGIFHEFLNLVTENKSIFENAILKEAVRKLPKEEQDEWDDLIQHSKKTPTSSTLRKSLQLYRDNIAYHYKQSHKNLLVGIERYIKLNPEARGYISYGATMPNTWFYFADAAAEQYMKSVYDLTTFDKELAQLAERVVRLIGHTVRSFVQQSAGSLRREEV